MTTPAWVSAVREREAADEAAQQQAYQAKVDEKGKEACQALREEVVDGGWLPDGVRLVKCVYSGSREHGDVTVSTALHLDLGDGFEVYAWKSVSGYMYRGNYVFVKTPEGREVGKGEWNRESFQKALADAYENLAKLRAEREAEEQRKRERAERHAIQDRNFRAMEQAMAEARDELWPFACEVVKAQGEDPHDHIDVWDILGEPRNGAERVGRPERFGFDTSKDEEVDRFREYVADLVKKAKANTPKLVAYYQAREKVTREAREQEYLPCDVKVYEVTYPVGFVAGAEDSYVETRTVLSLTPEPAPDGFWPTVQGDDVVPVRVLNVHGAIQVVERTFRKGTSVHELPYQLVKNDYLRGECGTDAFYQRPSRAVVEVAAGSRKEVA